MTQNSEFPGGRGDASHSTSMTDYPAPGPEPDGHPPVREDGWGQGSPNSTRRPEAPEHPTLVDVGQAVNMPHMALVKWSVESPEGAESGMMTVNLTAPLILRLLRDGRDAMRLVAFSRDKELLNVRATQAGANELYSDLWERLSVARINYANTVRQRKKALPGQGKAPGGPGPSRNAGRPEGNTTPPPGLVQQSRPAPARHATPGGPAQARGADSGPDPQKRRTPTPLLVTGALLGVVALLAIGILIGQMVMSSKSGVSSDAGNRPGAAAPQDRRDDAPGRPDQDKWTPS